MYSQSDFNEAEIQFHADLKDSSVCSTDWRMGVCVWTIIWETVSDKAIPHTAAGLLCIPPCVCASAYVCAFGLGVRLLHYRDLPCDVGRFINSRAL